MKTLVFDVAGPYAMFRKPFTPVSPVSYPFPPPPTVMGMVGAVCGYGKTEYLDRIGWGQVRIGIALRGPVKRYRAGINLVNTKGNKYFRLSGENPRVQIPHEFIKDAMYRIYVAGGKVDAMTDLEGHLRQGTNVYTPSLGLAQCLADVSFVDAFEAHPLAADAHKVTTVVPVEQADRVQYEPERHYGVFRVPVRMGPDRVVSKYEEVVVDEEARGITVETACAFDVGGARVLLF